MKTQWPLSQNPQVMSGTVVFAGTRVPVSNFFDYVEGGYTIEQFLAGFPGVSHEQINALLEMLREDLREKEVQFNPRSEVRDKPK